MKTQDELLVLLKTAAGHFYSGEQLAAQLGVSRTTIWKEINTLRHLGYEIDAVPHEGYHYVSAPDRLFADEIRWGLTAPTFGRQIFSYDSLDSTNDMAWRLGEQGLPEGVCVFAEHQKKGRGRMGREWSSPKHKAILMSVLLRPELPPAGIPRITLTAAVSVLRALHKSCNITAGVKWPNDLVHDDKKLCGILTEMSAEQDRVRFVVLGIGLNVNSRAKELPAGSTSLRDIAGHEFSRVTLAQAILIELEKDMKRLKKGDFASISEEWEEHSQTTGQRVIATLIDRSVQGHATGIDTDGALWIRKDNGLQERILSGDVKHLRPKA